MADDPRLAPARAFIAQQVDLIKAGDVEALRAQVTDRLKERVSADGLRNAVKSLGNMTVDDLVAGVEASGEGMKIKMKNGRTLTTLMMVEGVWKADTLWFK